MPSKSLLVQGSTLKISVAEAVSTAPLIPPSSYASLDCTTREVQWQGGQADEIDTTTFCSTAKEFRLGLGDSGTLTHQGHYLLTDPAYQVFKAADLDKKPRLLELIFADNSKFACLALVQQRSFGAAVNGVVTATTTFRLTGAPLETAGV